MLSDLEIGSLHISFLIGKMGTTRVTLWRYRNGNDDDVYPRKMPTMVLSLMESISEIFGPAFTSF